MGFHLLKRDTSSHARAGLLQTEHGEIHTPIFMPVGTLGSVKGVEQTVLRDTIGAQIILANTYHLMLRPGADIVETAGGLHAFMNWDGPILTDSGGYQVYSLGQMRKISEQGVSFQSHIDGARYELTPESAIDIQMKLGADIIMTFDECTPYPCDYSYARKSMELTHRWLDRCFEHFETLTGKYGYKPILAPIVQGSTFRDLRIESAKTIAAKDAGINAIGGLSVGEPHDEMYAMTEVVCEVLPEDKPRYLMGVGTPANILECIALGIDMFDCVLPSRNARHGLLYTRDGVINIRNEKWKEDFSPIDANGSEWSKRYSKAYLRHLVLSKELLAASIATVHNLHFYLNLVSEARKRILEGTFASWKTALVPRLSRRI